MMNSNFIKISVIISFTAILCGCDALYRVLHKEGAEEKELIGEIIPFESNPIVEEVQKLLHLYGYKSGNIDGKLGPNTRRAIERFQLDNGLKATKYLDHDTWETLHAYSASGLIVEGEVDIATVQRALKNAGFNAGPVDGKFGPQTVKSLKKFQKAMGLKDDGAIGFKTLKELDDFLPIE